MFSLIHSLQEGPVVQTKTERLPGDRAGTDLECSTLLHLVSEQAVWGRLASPSRSRRSQHVAMLTPKPWMGKAETLQRRICTCFSHALVLTCGSLTRKWNSICKCKERRVTGPSRRRCLPQPGGRTHALSICMVLCDGLTGVREAGTLMEHS